VAVVPLVGALLGVDCDLGSIHHHDEIARIDVRGVNRLVLPPQDAGDLTGQPPQHHALGVDEVPGAGDVCLLWGEGPHPGLPFIGRGHIYGERQAEKRQP
jgi:hypothetical protein